ncbi:MAG: hypothetical protein KKH92_09750 [Firmicutes bacterium]|nr:hypothetical protein [Bacillota bacterium]
MSIDSNRVIFVQVLDMERYNGIYDEKGNQIDDYASGGGSYTDDKKYEQFNFRPMDGQYYGYTPPYAKINLDKLNKDNIQRDSKGRRFINDVTVVFTTTGGSYQTGRYICGFYAHARVYEKPISIKNAQRYIHKYDQYASFNVIAKVENSLLLPRHLRTYQIENGKKVIGGFGQSNMWYADQNDEYRETILKYINELYAFVKSKQ